MTAASFHLQFTVAGRISASGHPPLSLAPPTLTVEGGDQAEGWRGLFFDAAERSLDRARDSATSCSQSRLNRS